MWHELGGSDIIAKFGGAFKASESRICGTIMGKPNSEKLLLNHRVNGLLSLCLLHVISPTMYYNDEFICVQTEFQTPQKTSSHMKLHGKFLFLSLRERDASVATNARQSKRKLQDIISPTSFTSPGFFNQVKQSKPAPAPTKKPSKHKLPQKIRKGKPTFQLVDEAQQESIPQEESDDPDLDLAKKMSLEAHQEKGEGEGDDADMERAIKLSLDPAFLPQGQAPVGGVTIRDPVSETTPKLPEVVARERPFVKEASNEAKVKHEIDVLETINIELESSVAKLLAENEKLNKENEHLKQTYKELYDSIKRTRIQTKDHNDSLIAQVNSKTVENADLKA
ncbi:hypothetical protein Tco_0045837 [Tanacetum coccineum]